MNPKRFSLIVLLVCAFDQVSKVVAEDYISLNERLQVIPGFFDLTITYNRGAAFGLFSGIDDGLIRGLALTFSTLIALLVVFYFLFREARGSVSGQMGCALVLGGAAGNIIDRIAFSQVTDFFLVYYKHYEWPVFNIADSAISIGAVLLIFMSSVPKQPKEEQ